MIAVMLSRVLEPEVMDSPEEASDYDAMDHTAVNRAFVDDLLTIADPQQSKGTILDVGTGTARIPIELCGREKSLRVVGIDMSASMLRVGHSNVNSARLMDRIALELIDAKRMPYDNDRFVCVISNSIVHHIPDPAVVLSEAGRVTAPGGTLFFRDLLRPP